MATIKWVQVVDANQKQILNAVAHNVNGNPGSPVAGQFWYDTVTGTLRYRDGIGVANIDLRDRTTHSGTQLAATISNFDTQVRTSRLDQMAVPTSSINFNSQKGINQADPTGPQDSATKNYVDSALATATSGLTWKATTRVATTANIATLAGGAPNIVDGIGPLSVADRVLVKNQTTVAQNGIYTVTTVGTGVNGTWTRATDADVAAELQGGAVVPVDEGTVNHDTAWMLATDVVTLGTDAVTWTQFGAGTAYTASLGVQLVGNDFRANLGTGLTLSTNQIVPDYTQILQRKVYIADVPSGSVDAVVTTGFTVADRCDQIVQVTEKSTGIQVECGITRTTTQVTLSFDVAPTAAQYRVAVIGLS